ncbi:MAG: hypothetical protein M1840_001405 [Geoglossum simile]|nr:MAG: hypothetical protein M1840_001405 [Geoglossum simile]
MRFSTVAAAALSLAAGATAGYSNASYVTEVVTAYTTYCPVPTVITHNNVTYTVTELLDLSYAPVAPAPPKNVTYTASNTLAAAYPTAAATFTGAANKAFAASGAGLAGLLGLAAYIL